MSTPGVQLSEAELREGLSACLPVRRWVDDVVAAAPFGSLLELLDVAAAAATPLSPAEVDEALTHQPHLGERTEASDASAADAELAQALVEGVRAYEERFGRVFLIRTAGRTRTDVVTELRRRLALEPGAELDVVASELRDLALMRIPQLFAHLDHHSGFDDADAAQ